MQNHPRNSLGALRALNFPELLVLVPDLALRAGDPEKILKTPPAALAKSRKSQKENVVPFHILANSVTIRAAKSKSVGGKNTYTIRHLFY